MAPPPEVVHWLFAVGFLKLGLCVVCEVAVGPDVWRMHGWRPYLWPTSLFVMGMFMWAVMVFFTNSTVHMIAHGLWAQGMMIGGVCLLGLARGKLRSPLWTLSVALALLVGGTATLVHESQGLFFNRSSFLHHLEGWGAIGASVFPIGLSLRPQSRVSALGLALLFFFLAILLLCHRDSAAIFGHMSPDARPPAAR